MQLNTRPLQDRRKTQTRPTQNNRSPSQDQHKTHTRPTQDKPQDNYKMRQRKTKRQDKTSLD